MKEHKLCKVKWFAQGQKLIIAKREPEFRFPGSQFKDWQRQTILEMTSSWESSVAQAQNSICYGELKEICVSPEAKMRNVNLRWLQDVTSLESNSLLSSSFNFCYTGLHQYRQIWHKVLNQFIWWTRQLWKLYQEWEHQLMLWVTFKKWVSEVNFWYSKNPFYLAKCQHALPLN